MTVFLHERQSAWLQGLEGVFRHFGGVPQEIRLDNARALVTEHNMQTREVKFNDRFHAFCRYWGVAPWACAPYRARTKGKDERVVGYVKRNAIAGHGFDSLEALHAHIARWTREIADTRVHATTGEPPLVRFEREATALRPLPAKAPFLQVRELTRRVHTDACIELDTNRYSVPWKLIGESVTVSSLEANRQAVRQRIEQGVSGTAIHLALQRGHGWSGSYSAVRRLVADIRQDLPQEVTCRLEFAPGERGSTSAG